MTSELVYLVTGLGLLIGTVLPRLLHRRALSMPMIVLGFGVLVGIVLPGEEPMSPVLDAAATAHLAEAAVIVSLMGVGLAIDRPLGWRAWGTTWRLLAFAMPLTIAGVALLGWGVAGLTVPAAVLLGAVLAPTDPVLASEMQVPPPTVEEDLDPGEDEDAPQEDADLDEDPIRFALTSEAGLNDALAFPFVYLGLYLMGRGPIGGWITEWVLWTLLGKVVVGAVVGAVCGMGLARMAFRSKVKELRVAEAGNPLLALGATFAIYGVTELIGGYGFLAVFAAALAIRSVERGHGYHRQLHELIERLETILTLVLLLMLGVAMSSGLLVRLGWREALVGIVLVAVVRPLAAWVSLARGRDLTGTARWTVAAFGVRGIGSVFYLAFALSHEHVDEALELWSVVAFAITLSVIVHGVAANPVMQRLERSRAEVLYQP